MKNRALVWIDVEDKSKDIFRILTSHLTVTNEGEVSQIQLDDNERFINNVKSLGELVFCGDTNAPRGRSAFGGIAEVFKDNIPLEYVTSLDQNLHRVKGLPYMIDCLFTTPKYKALNVKLIDGVSDHMAVVADIEKI